METQTIHVSTPIVPRLIEYIAGLEADKLFVLMDSNTRAYCWSLIEGDLAGFNPIVIEVGAGEAHKTIETTIGIWKKLTDSGATRHSLLLNVGGGVITDMGGFAAATYKRGIRCVNIPTTLLGAVDASVGGKTGVDFEGLKNEIGSFYPAVGVFVDPQFFRSLSRENLLSGYAEMLKHSLLESDSCWLQHLNFDFDAINYGSLNYLVRDSIRVKQNIVHHDPYEKGLRKALNLGHTVGHAIESLALEKGAPILHGYAVAWGIMCELYFSSVKCEFPLLKLQRTIRFIKRNYGICSFDENDYELLYQRMKHDKKNKGDEIRFSLLSDVGCVILDQALSKDLIFEAFDYLKEG